MEPNALRQRLEDLHAELSRAASVDPGSSRLLQDVLADIHRLLEAQPPGTPPVGLPAEAGSAADRLEQLALQFAAAHPALAESSRRLVDLLGKMGV